jgi:putative ABC transport system substrate-binding protein
MKVLKLTVLMLLASCLISFNALADKKKVSFLRYQLPPMNFSDVIDGYKKVMKQNGYVEGENIEYIDLLTSTGDKASVPEAEAFTQEQKNNVDMFVSCGWVSMYARKILQDTSTPQLFIPVLKKVAYKLVPTLEAGSGSNISGIYLIYPPEKILKLLKLTLPGAKKYGVCWNSKVPADVIFKESFDELKDNMGIQIVYFDLAEGVDPVIAQLKQSGVDAFGGCVGFRKPQFDALFHLDIPIVSAKLDHENAEATKKTNEIIGFWNSFGAGGEQAAEMTLAIWEGKTTIENTVPQAIKKQVIYVNKVGTDRMGIKISPVLLKVANVVYE